MTEGIKLHETKDTLILLCFASSDFSVYLFLSVHKLVSKNTKYSSKKLLPTTEQDTRQLGKFAEREKKS